MKRRWANLLALGLLAGCQAKPATPPPAPVPVPTVAPAASRPADARVQDVTKLVEAETKSIEAVPAVPSAVPPAAVIEPGRPPVAAARPAVPPVSPPPPEPKGPAVAAVQRAIADAPPARKPADDGFKPVPPMTGVIRPEDVAITPPSDPAVTPTPTPLVVSSPPTTPTTPTPDPVRPPVAPASGGSMSDELVQKARRYPHDLGPQLDAQLCLLLQGQKVPTDESIAGLNTEDRDVLTSLLDGLTNLRIGIEKEPNALLTRKIRPMVEMTDRLRSRADMSIVNANLCRVIRGFGNFDPITPLKLPAGVNLKPKLYFEVENITPRLDANNMWATVMRLDLTLFDSAGAVKWSLPNLAVTDLCKNRRRDFFFGCILNFPLNLMPDNYTLKLTLTDEVARRVTELGLAVAIVPPTNAMPALPGQSQQVGPQLPR